jgi:hypothetical protein
VSSKLIADVPFLHFLTFAIHLNISEMESKVQEESEIIDQKIQAICTINEEIIK